LKTGVFSEIYNGKRSESPDVTYILTSVYFLTMNIKVLNTNRPEPESTPGQFMRVLWLRVIAEPGHSPPALHPGVFALHPLHNP
jgi:hypothetical protein